MGKGRVIIMEEGLCHRRHCFNKGVRCGIGYCGACCKAFHEHTHPSNPPATPPTSTFSTPIPSSPISTAIPTPDPAPVYEAGSVQLTFTQNFQGR